MSPAHCRLVRVTVLVSPRLGPIFGHGVPLPGLRLAAPETEDSGPACRGAAAAVCAGLKVHARARIPDRCGLRNSAADGRATLSLLLHFVAGDGSIGACSFLSPISPSRLCCGCWSAAAEASSPKTSNCS